MILINNLILLFEIGGPVMLLIYLISAWLWILIVLKSDWLWRSNRSGMALADALKYLKDEKPSLSSCCPRAQALNHFMTTRRRGSSNRDVASEKLFLEVAVRRQTGTIQKFIPTIILLAATAPLLGLFGTVSGMVDTFRVIGMYGMGNAQAMASGIREAMITTQAGLLVAIPGVFIGQVLKKKTRSIQSDLLVFQNGISQWIEKEYGA